MNWIKKLNRQVGLQQLSAGMSGLQGNIWGTPYPDEGKMIMIHEYCFLTCGISKGKPTRN